MGLFKVKIGIGNINGGDEQEVEAVVDTGATHTTVPGDLLDYMHVDRAFSSNVLLADGMTTTWDTGVAAISCEGKRGWCPVFFGPKEADVLLGATTLEILGFVVNPVTQRLEHTALRS